jgi:hypothetical protein
VAEEEEAEETIKRIMYTNKLSLSLKRSVNSIIYLLVTTSTYAVRDDVWFSARTPRVSFIEGVSYIHKRTSTTTMETTSYIHG